MRRIVLIAAAFLLCTAPAPVAAGQGDPAAPPAVSDPASGSDTLQDQPTQADIEELRRRLDILADELEQLRSGEVETVDISPERQRQLGLAPSAAATYRRTTSGVSLAGYGEMLLENYANQNQSGTGDAPTTQLDFLRAILYAGYRFNDQFLFNSEIEIEHANEVSVEFAYVDYMPNEHLTIRGGMVLIPLGLVNEFHEPTVFLGARRSETETRIIPSTWRENGGGVLGTVGPVNFRAYVTNGLNGAGFSAAGIRGGRQKGAKAKAANMAFSGRLDVTPVPGVFAGVGVYRGGSGQEAVVLDGTMLTVGTSVVEVHGQAQIRGVDVRALFARATVDEAGDVSRALDLATSAPIASAMQGGYLQVGYDVLSQTNAVVGLTPYVRYERVNTQHEVPAGFTPLTTRDGTFRTLGVELKPIPNVTVKVDHQWTRNEASTGRNQFNLALGYAF